MTDLKDDLAALRIDRGPERSGLVRIIGWTLVLLVVASLAGGGWVWATRERPVEVEVSPVAERASGTQAAVLNASGTSPRAAAPPFPRRSPAKSSR